MKKYWLGKKFSEEHRLNLSLSHKGQEPWNTGIIGSKSGENNGKWQGDKISYPGLHQWVRKTLGSAIKCSFNQNHKSIRYHWANISGAYLREIEDWIQLCPRCHKQYDKITNKTAKNIFNVVNKQYADRRVFLR